VILPSSAIAGLRAAMQAGWSQPGDLKGPDFDSVRQHSDFRELLAELEKTATESDTGPGTERKE
jgi:hypothetical protein